MFDNIRKAFKYAKAFKNLKKEIAKIKEGEVIGKVYENINKIIDGIEGLKRELPAVADCIKPLEEIIKGIL